VQYPCLVRNKAVYLALGIMADGTKDILGLWIETSEGAKFWLRVMNELTTAASAIFSLLWSTG
jgi:transposase-like protein